MRRKDGKDGPSGKKWGGLSFGEDSPLLCPLHMEWETSLNSLQRKSGLLILEKRINSGERHAWAPPNYKMGSTVPMALQSHHIDMRACETVPPLFPAFR